MCRAQAREISFFQGLVWADRKMRGVSLRLAADVAARSLSERGWQWICGSGVGRWFWQWENGLEVVGGVRGRRLAAVVLIH